MSSGPTLVCFALKEEASPFRRAIIGRADISILVTGIGPTNSKRFVEGFLTANSPCAVLTCGFAGGLNPHLAVGEVVFATDDTQLREKLDASGARHAKFHYVSRIAETVAEKAQLRSTTEADAVEMESEAIQAICHERGISCATVRAISDAANDDLPLDFNKLSGPDLGIHYGKLAFAVLKQPTKIPALMRLQKNCRFAAHRLADVLMKVVTV